MKIQFLGAAETVTGSRYLMTFGHLKVLVDCGLFQGYKNLRLKNWEAFPVPPAEIDAILLTHAHLDHSGYIPRLIQSGFRGKIFCTVATRDLCAILLPDSGFLQEEEARFQNKHGATKHQPALPLYTERDAEASLHAFESVPWKKRQSITCATSTDKIEFEFHPAGHLFGAASIVIFSEGKSIAFSGDLGRTADPVTRNPDFHIGADTLIVESTYGNRRHVDHDPQSKLKDIILSTYQKGGTLLIPSFAVGRAQLVLYYIHRLKLAGEIPDIPVFLNSPMASKANSVFRKHHIESKLSEAEAAQICNEARAVASVEESMEVNNRKDPMILIAASGMATGGRVLHHLKTFAPDARNTILFVGFQAAGTRGDAITHGAEEIKIHGAYWPVRATVAQLDSMSAHADGDELLSWIQGLAKKPRRVFVTHGEPAAADDLRRRICEMGIPSCTVPEFGQEFTL